LVDGLDEDGLYHWRLRVVHDAVTTPFLPASRWFTPPTNGRQELDFRVPTCIDEDGDGYGLTREGSWFVGNMVSHGRELLCGT